MAKTILPKGYEPVISLGQTEIAIKEIKDFFQTSLSAELKLRRVTAPLFVRAGTGINDDLNGVEKPVAFQARDITDHGLEIVQSLAKWKRLQLAHLDIPSGFGIYTDMNAIRPDEDLDNTHSLYVDQWDWERVMLPEQRSVEFLKTIVTRIYEVIKRTEFYVTEKYPQIKPELPDEIFFVHAEELRKMYPNLSPMERETRLAKQKGAIFVIGIGGNLGDGEKHDGRAPDYDDWSTVSSDGLPGLNGDIVVWNHVLEKAYEISSMGIRVDKVALLRQLDIRGCPERKELFFHKLLLEDKLPQSIGGGIGQSRLCMYFLRKAHIGEVQSSEWPVEVQEMCQKAGIPLL